MTIPQAGAGVPLDRAFDRDKFLLRQKHLAISEKYFVWDDAGTVVMFIQRPVHLLRALLAVLALFATAAVCGLVTVAVLSVVANETAKLVLGIGGFLLAVFAAIAVTITVMPRRNVHFYRDESKKQPLLEIQQDQKLALLTATFTIKDAAAPLGLTLPTVGTSIERLESRGLATELTGQLRNRVWIATAWVELITAR